MIIDVLYDAKSFNRHAEVEVDGDSLVIRGDQAIVRLLERYKCEECGPISELSKDGTCPYCLGKGIEKSDYIATNEQLEVLKELGEFLHMLKLTIVEDGSLTATIDHS